METDILIVGGGLSGLALADHLHRAGRNFKLVEARDRLGGRIKTEHLDHGYFDLGPAWYWPGQLRMADLIARLGLRRFEQYADGILTHEDEHGQVQRGRGYASMQGSYRVVGGLSALIDAVASEIPDQHIRLNATITGLARAEGKITAALADGTTIVANRVVMALPPRVAAEITFSPALPEAAIRAMQQISTWMAGQAKAIAIYDTAFWRKAGLSGDAMSRFGPMVEIHDASPVDGGPFALFGFIGVPPQGRGDVALLKEHILAQLTRLFGPDAATPKALLLKDWAFDPRTATQADHAPLYAHPQYGLPAAMKTLWGGQILFAGTEVAPQFGGYLEGALEASENILHCILDP